MQASIICFEMLFFAVVHRKVFSWRDFVLEEKDVESKPLTDALTDFGQKELGLRSISPPWLSFYVDGCEQALQSSASGAGNCVPFWRKLLQKWGSPGI